jgi:AmmeMemoRadiSam system protein A
MTPDPPPALTDHQRGWLLRLARATIEASLRAAALPDDPPSPGPLTETRGAFVTLTEGGVLRGCIGHVVGTEPLWMSVRSNAVNAAFHDPRFPPVEVTELPALTLEISALTPLWRVNDPADIVVGRDGLVVERGPHRGLLLPQVAERYGWTPTEFLDQTCRKAGMHHGCWRDPATVISAFSAEVFSEDEFASEADAGRRR